MNNLLNSLPEEIVYLIVFIFILVILIAVFILINPNFLFGYYTPGFLGWSGYLPWFGSAYNGLYGFAGYGGIYPYFSFPYTWNNPFLYSQFTILLPAPPAPITLMFACPTSMPKGLLCTCSFAESTIKSIFSHDPLNFILRKQK